MSIKTIYHCVNLTGGINSTYLDYADGNSLLDKDRAFVIVAGVAYLYELNATSGAAESSPNVIAPDTNAGTKRWILIGQNLAGLTFTAAAVGFTIAGGTTSKTLTVSADATLDEAVAMSSKAPKASPIFTGDVTLSGKATNATAPSFLVTENASQANVTGDGTVYTVLFSTEIFDKGGNFASNTFTAPVTGKYQLSGNIEFSGLLAGHNPISISLVTTARTYRFDKYFISGVNTFSIISMPFAVLVDMSLNDTAYLTVTVSGSTKVVGVNNGGASTLIVSYFSGFLAN